MDRLNMSWVFVIPAWAWSLLFLWCASGGAICLLEGMLLFFVAVLAALVWVTGGVLLTGHEQGRALLCWLHAPVVCVAAVVVSATDGPMFVRFGLSYPALQSHAERDDSGTWRDKHAQYIGLFHVEEVWRHGRTVAFVTDGKLFDRVGVIYAPDGLPTDLPMEVETLLFAKYTHISGPWYKFEMP